MDDSVERRLARRGMTVTPGLRRDYELHREQGMEPAWARVHTAGAQTSPTTSSGHGRGAPTGGTNRGEAVKCRYPRPTYIGEDQTG